MLPVCSRSCLLFRAAAAATAPATAPRASLRRYSAPSAPCADHSSAAVRVATPPRALALGPPPPPPPPSPQQRRAPFHASASSPAGFGFSARAFHRGAPAESLTSAQAPTGGLTPIRVERVSREAADHLPGGGGNIAADAIEVHGTDFYSREYRPSAAEIASFLQRHRLFHQISRFDKTELVVKCPGNHTSKGFFETGRLNTEDGSYHCSQCRLKGPWHIYANKAASQSPVANDLKLAGIREPSTDQFRDTIENIQRYPDQLQELPEDELSNFEHATGINRDTLKHFGVGLTERSVTDPTGEQTHDLHYISYPLTRFGADQQSPVVQLKLVQLELSNPAGLLEQNALNSQHTLFEPARDVLPGMFGYSAVRTDNYNLVITGNELDAMAVYQQTGLAAVALPNPIQLPPQLLPLLERFVRIDIWFDDTPQMREAAHSHARKIGLNRTWVIEPPESVVGKISPAAALKAGQNLETLLSHREKPAHKDVLRFPDFRRQVQRFILDPDTARGVPSVVLPAIDDVLKGLRKGELTVWTGATGVGKTTILSHLSMGYAMSGVPTIWGSFEIPNPRLGVKMLNQMAGKSLEEHPKEFQYHADNFERLPIHFLDFFGSTSVDDVVSALSHAVYAYDIGLVVLDNLQFMLSGQGRNGMDKWAIQDEAIAALRRFATEKNVHVVIVAHPRKENKDSASLDIASVYGSVKTTQEADNVVVMKKAGPEMKYLEIMKQRFDGTIGKVPYHVDPKSKAVRNLNADEILEFEDALEAQSRVFAAR